MTDRDRPLPGQDPQAWRAGGPSGPELRELQATDALLDRLALRLPSRDDRRDPIALALVAMTTEVDAGLPVSGKHGRYGYGPLNGAANGHRVNAGDEQCGSASQQPSSLADWKDRLVELAVRKPMVVLGVAAATVAVISGGIAMGRVLAPLPGMTILPGSGSTSQNQQLASQINSALSRADLAADKGQPGNARQALEDAQRAVAKLPQSAAKETYQQRIEKLRLKVDKTAVPPITPVSPSRSVAASPTSSPSASPTLSVSGSPSTSVSASPTQTTSPSTSPSTSPTTVTTSPTGVPTFAGSDDPPDPTPTDDGEIPNGSSTSGSTAP